MGIWMSRTIIFLAFGWAMNSASAAIISTSGPVLWLASPPSSVQLNQLQNNSFLYVFNERVDVSASPIVVDITAPGTYEDPYVNSPTAISGGIVDSYYLHYDPSNFNSIENVSITFDTDILGLMVDTTTLSTGDVVFGSPSTTYSTLVTKGLELNDVIDRISLSADRRTITVLRWGVTDGMDQMRVITAASVVPVPAAIWLFGGALGALVITKRRAKSAA